MARDELVSTFKAGLSDRQVLQRIARELGRYNHDVRELREAVGADAEIIFQAHAPKGRSGRLSRGIRARSHGSDVVIEAHARDPETGFDYVRVSRFGHTVRRIYAGAVARSLSSPARFTAAGGVRSRPLKGAQALNTPFGLFASVRGFHPKVDWAEAAYHEVQEVAGEHMEAFGRGIVRRIGTGPAT